MPVTGHRPRRRQRPRRRASHCGAATHAVAASTVVHSDGEPNGSACSSRSTAGHLHRGGAEPVTALRSQHPRRSPCRPPSSPPVSSTDTPIGTPIARAGYHKLQCRPTSWPSDGCSSLGHAARKPQREYSQLDGGVDRPDIRAALSYRRRTLDGCPTHVASAGPRTARSLASTSGRRGFATFCPSSPDPAMPSDGAALRVASGGSRSRSARPSGSSARTATAAG